MRFPFQKKEYDFTRRRWGHDFTFHPNDAQGQTASMTGWLKRNAVKAGDYFILPNGPDTTRYQIKSIIWFLDPPDMFQAKVKFAPRKQKENP